MILVIFTVYLVLDTFVIPRTLAVVESEEADENETAEVSSSGKKDRRTASRGAGTKNKDTESSISASLPGSSENAYEDGNISIEISEYRVGDTNVYVADVTLSSAEYLKTAFAGNAYGRNITAKTSVTAAANHAILAVNGDFYGTREKGYVLRNGVLYRSTPSKNQENLVIYEDGSFEIINESSVSAEELLSKGAVQILSFGPALVENGVVSVSESDEVGMAKASNPRTAIAIIDELHYLFIVSDGRTGESEGLSLYELAVFAKDLGAETVYNLDGGGSSTMVFGNSVINDPTSGGSIKERSVSDIVYIGY